MPQAATKARPATFDAAIQERRVLIAKIHVAKKEMQPPRRRLSRNADRGDRAGELGRLHGRRAPRDGRGDEAPRASQPKKAGEPAAADHPFAAKARALWISLYHLGAIDNPSEQALEAFARRQLGSA
jgi:phage gp16-like protein